MTDETHETRIVTGAAPGRFGAGDITICDLAGTGAQDTAIACHVLDPVHAAGAGQVVAA